jgi:hypothetical protein
MNIIDYYMEKSEAGVSATAPVSEAVVFGFLLVGLAFLVLFIFPFFLLGLVVGKRDAP